MSHQDFRRWFKESGSWEEQHHFEIKGTVYRGRTSFQKVEIYDTTGYGKMLVLDGYCQSSQKDEYVYHESLVHPGLTAHPNPRSVLVIGGGEGATIREVLRHPSIERVVMVDLDRELILLCDRLLPEWHGGAFHDPRVEMVFADGKQYVEGSDEKFDVIIIDVCDDLDDGPAQALYTENFYRTIKNRLTANGIVVVQAMELHGLETDPKKNDHLKVRWRLNPVFKYISSYYTHVPSFWGTWGFVIASDAIDMQRLTADSVNQQLHERRMFDILRFYDGETHRHMFALPRDVRRVIAYPQSELSTA